MNAGTPEADAYRVCHVSHAERQVDIPVMEAHSRFCAEGTMAHLWLFVGVVSEEIGSTLAGWEGRDCDVQISGMATSTMRLTKVCGPLGSPWHMRLTFGP